jgi:hypothetical protein
MKQYQIDELRPVDHEKIRTFMDESYGSSKFDGLYWIPLEEDILTSDQSAHSECRPFFFAIELKPGMMTCEFFVRTKNRIKCTCMGYATEIQRNWLVDTIDTILNRLNISI